MEVPARSYNELGPSSRVAMRQLKGKTAVITGAGSGIGRALALQLGSAGCQLALVDIQVQALEQTRDLLTATGANQVSLHAVSVADREDMRGLPSEIMDIHGHIDILINNAGVTALASFEELSDADIDRIIGVNLLGTLMGCRFFLPHLKKAPEAHIVNMSSMAAFAGMPYQTIYCATKSAVQGLTESLQAELSGTNLTVTGVYPGAVGTHIMASASSPHAVSQRLGELLLRHGYPVDRAARKIVRGIKRKSLMVRIGAQSYLLDWSKRLFPWLISVVMGFIARRGRAMLVAEKSDNK